MLKNKLDFKLVNLLILLLLIFVVYQLRVFWTNIFSLFISIIKPFFISLIISYVFNLFLRKLNKYFNKYISFLILIMFMFIMFYFVFFVFLPILIDQIISFVNILLILVKNFSVKYEINLFALSNKLVSIIDILPNLGTLVNFGFINTILDYFTFISVVVICSIYLFFDFDKICDRVKNISIKNSKFYKFLNTLNSEFEKYISSFFVLVVINIIEYMLVFFIVGHPNYMILGFMAGLLSIIPYFGGIVTNCCALIIGFVVNYGLFIRTLIGILVLSIIDGYVVSPFVYGKGSKIHPILIIMSVYISSKFFGILGVVMSVPFLVFLNVFYKFYIKKTD